MLPQKVKLWPTGQSLKSIHLTAVEKSWLFCIWKCGLACLVICTSCIPTGACRTEPLSWWGAPAEAAAGHPHKGTDQRSAGAAGTGRGERNPSQRDAPDWLRRSQPICCVSLVHARQQWWKNRNELGRTTGLSWEGTRQGYGFGKKHGPTKGKNAASVFSSSCGQQILTPAPTEARLFIINCSSNTPKMILSEAYEL